MTKKEASEKYQIPMEILEEYEKWNLCGEIKKVMGTWKYDDSDLDKLGMIMTLNNIGFSNAERPNRKCRIGLWHRRLRRKF